MVQTFQNIHWNTGSILRPCSPLITLDEKPEFARKPEISRTVIAEWLYLQHGKHLRLFGTHSSPWLSAGVARWEKGVEGPRIRVQSGVHRASGTTESPLPSPLEAVQASGIVTSCTKSWFLVNTGMYQSDCTEYYILVRHCNAENGTMIPVCTGMYYSLAAVCTLLSVLKSHFARACIRLFKQLSSKGEKRFVRTHWLYASRRFCEWGLFYLLVSVSFDSEDLKRLRALSPLGQKHAFRIWTGNLPIVHRNALTTEPRLQIWHI